MSEYTTITEDHFGVIYTGNMPNRVDVETFLDAAEYTGISAIRWPGGTLAEKGFKDPESNTFYDLTVPDLMENRSGEGADPVGLTEMLDVARSNGLGFTLIVPTLSYASPEKGGSMEAPNLDLAYAEYKTFLEQLLVEEAWGPLPTEFTLEIGNEALIHFGEAQDIYGQIANTFLSAYDAVLDEHGIENEDIANLAMQMGISSDQSMNQTVIDQIDDDLAHHIDSVRNHELNKGHGLSWDKGWAGLNDAALIYYEDWLDKTGKTEDTLDHYVSAWNTGKPVEKDAQGKKLPLDPQAVDYGMKELSAVVEMFANFSLLSVDQAAHWGVAVSASHPNETSSVDAEGVVTYSPKGEALHLLSETLIGTSLAHDITKDLEGNPIRKGHFRSEEDEVLDPEALRVFIFEDDDKYVVYVAANRFETAQTDGETTFTIDLASYLETPDEIVSGWSDQITSDVAAFDFEDTTRQLTATTTRHDIDVSEHSFSVTLSQNYELAQVVLVKEGAEDPDLGTDTSGPADEDHSGALLIIPGSGALRPSIDSILAAIRDPDLSPGDLDFAAWAEPFDLSENLASDGVELSLDEIEGLLSDAPGVQIELMEPASPFGATAPIRGTGLNDFIRGASGRDTLRGEEGRDVLLGGDGADQLAGGADDDVLGGEGGDDFLEGGDQDDFLYGGTGNDILLGAAGADTLLGQAGEDVLMGGAGDDLLLGGSGADLFVIDSGHDLILDFELGLDRLELQAAQGGELAAVSDLSIHETAQGTRVEFGDDSVTLLGVTGIEMSDLLIL